MAAHDRGHISRVRRVAVYIATEEGADVEVVAKAAELHDVARGREDHARVGAEIARRLLHGQGYPPEFIDKVTHCILSHSFSSGITPATLEAKVLSDADKLDAIGAIGIARAFLYSGETGRSLEETQRHFEEKLLRLKDSLYTDTARRLAVERDRFLREFYAQLEQELAFPDRRR